MADSENRSDLIGGAGNVSLDDKDKMLAGASDSSDSSSARSSEAPSAASDESEAPPEKRRKVWLEHGLYLGQEDGDLKLRPTSSLTRELAS